MFSPTQRITKKDHTGNETATLCELSISQHCAGIAMSTLCVMLSSGDRMFLHECDACKDALVQKAQVLERSCSVR